MYLVLGLVTFNDMHLFRVPNIIYYGTNWFGFNFHALKHSEMQVFITCFFGGGFIQQRKYCQWAIHIIFRAL